MRKRDEQILLRVSKTERAALAFAAKKLGLTLNDFVRRQALASANDEADVERLQAAMSSLETGLADALDAARESITRDVENTVSIKLNGFADWIGKRLPRQPATRPAAEG